MFEAGAEKIDTVAEHGPISRSVLYEAIANGDLVARKHGRITLILREDWEGFLRSRPAIQIRERDRNSPTNTGVVARTRRPRGGAPSPANAA